MDRLWRVIRSALPPSAAGPFGSAPSPAELVTVEEVATATGGSPIGPGRRNGAGSPVDVGTLAICEWQLTNGDEFLVTLIRANDRAAANLAVDRQAEEMKPLPGVGDRGLVRVHKVGRGKSEIGVTGLQGSYVLSLTHTSTHGVVDTTPLTELLRQALGRLA